jgi:hypothetical protein
VVGGCAVPDQRAALAPLPEAALAYLAPDTVRTEALVDGVVYRYTWSARGPWAVHLVQVDLRGRCELALDVLRAEARETGGAGRERVSSMAQRSPGAVIVAVNADFFTPEGTTVGTELIDGRVRAATARPTIAYRPDRTPWIGRSAVLGDTIEIGWRVLASDGDGLTEAVGGFPELLDHGRRVGDLEVGARPSFAAERHPRTAVGYDPGSDRAWIVVIDGRQAPYSDGMTLPELAGLFEALGATEALNLDGGGSTVMVLGDSAVSRPSDLTGERPVVNALAVVEDPRGCALSDPR